MNPSLAKKRYMKTTGISMIFYMIAIFGVSFYLNIKYALALLPTIFVWWFIWGAIRFYKETDEYERAQLIGGMLIGVIAILLVSSGWGFMEMLADAPKLPVFWILPIFFGASGLGRYVTNPKGERC